MEQLKVNRKSIRLTDKVCRYIEGYRGENFNDKLENMVLDFEERSEDIKREWNMLQAAVSDKHKELRQLQEQVRKVRNIDVRFGPLVEALTQLLPQE